MREVNSNRTGIIEKPYNETSRDVERLFDSTQPRAVEGVIPNGGPNEQRGRGKTVTIDIGGYGAVISLEVAFAFSTGDLTRGCINAQLLIVPCVGLAVIWTRRRIGQDFIGGGLELRFAFPCRAIDTSSVSLTQDCNCAPSTAYTLIASNYGDVDQDRRRGDVIGSDVVRRRLCHEGVRTYCVRPAGSCRNISLVS